MGQIQSVILLIQTVILLIPIEMHILIAAKLSRPSTYQSLLSLTTQMHSQCTCTGHIPENEMYGNKRWG